MRTLSLVLLSLCQPLFGFGLHYLVTDRALPREDATLDQPLATETLDTFLQTEKTAVASLFADFYRDLAKARAKRFVPMTFDVEQANTAAFLNAARLNPNARFHYVRRLVPGQKASGASVPFRSLSLYEAIEPGVAYNFEAADGEVTPRQILTTYSDEPDWGMDNDLFSYPQYGYGKQPYGEEKGSGNQAPFHCQYAHENLIVKLVAREVTEGMSIQRVDLTSRLAQLAFRTGHPYWGYRFTAWATHYLQDISQPYHAKAVPFADAWFYVRYAFSSHKAQLKAEMTQLMIHHHNWYEDFVKMHLQSSYEKNEGRAAKLTAALADRALDRGAASPALLFDAASRWASKHAAKVDKAVTQAVGPAIDTKRDYEPADILERTDGPNAEPLILEAAENFRITGRVTRELLAYCRAAENGSP